MDDIRKAKLEEQFSDAALLLMMDDIAQAEGADLLATFEKSGMHIPEALDSACKKMIQKIYRKTEKCALLRRTVCRAAKIAAVMAVCLILSVNLILSVEAIRVPCLNFLIDAGKRISSISFSSSETEQEAPLDCSSPLPFYAPEGFTLTVAQNNHETDSMLFRDSMLLYLFLDGEGNTLQIQSLPAAGNLTLDTEDAQCTELMLGDLEVLYIKNDGLRIFWVDPELERVYDIYTNGMQESEFLDYVLHLSEKLQRATFSAE